MALKAGELTQRCTIQRKIMTEDVEHTGGKDIQYAPLATVWCRDVTGSKTGREIIETQTVKSKTPHVIQIRYRNDVKYGMRVALGSIVLKLISAVDPESTREELFILCEEVQE